MKSEIEFKPTTEGGEFDPELISADPESSDELCGEIGSAMAQALEGMAILGDYTTPIDPELLAEVGVAEK